MFRRHKTVLALAIGLVLLAVILIWRAPVSSLATPQWNVIVVDGNGKAVEGITVRETWQNYSVEREGHEADRQTDANGMTTFPARKSEYSALRQLAGTASTLIHLKVHASYGTHAIVFAFGKSLEGPATTGDFVTDWTGSPPSMSSRIIVKPAQ